MGTTTTGSLHGVPTSTSPALGVMRLGLLAAVCAAAAAAMQPTQRPAPAPEAAMGFDGRYGGTLTAAFEGRDGACAALVTLPGLIVAGDRAWTMGEGPALRGAVHAGGLAVLTGALDGPATLTGRFEGGRFTGELRGWTCTYSVALSQQS